MKSAQISFGCALAALAKTSFAQTMRDGLSMYAYNSKNCDPAVDYIVETNIGSQ